MDVQRSSRRRARGRRRGRRRGDVDAVYRAESRRVLATLIRLLGDFDLAEEALHDAFAAALEHWPRDGVPANPRAWLVSAGRFKAIDALRRRARFDASLGRARRAARGVGRRRCAVSDDEERRGRPPAADLHLLPSGAAAGRAGRAHAARGVRPDHRGDRARVPHHGADASRSASCAPRPRSATRAFPYQVPARDDLPERLDARAARRLPRLQRGLLGVVGRVADARTICRPRRSGSGACWSSCCPSPRRWACWR